MKISVKPRIHITLISMHSGGYRKNGGIGLSLENPKGLLEFSRSEQFCFNDKRQNALPNDEREQLLGVLRKTQRLLKLDNSISIELSGGLLTHVGMGSGTALRLACLEALLRLNGRSATPNTLVELSQRGGTSGIGIQTYFSGQFVFDLGVKNENDLFSPSSTSHNSQVPLLLQAINFPNWPIGLCIPHNVPSRSQAEEIEFFSRSCPIKSEESYKTLFHSLLGTYASVREGDILTFSQSISAIQQCEWKRLERTQHSSDLMFLEERLYACGAMCVGMSSLGPLLYFLAPEDKSQAIKSLMRESNCNIIFTKASNTGREIQL